jgi:hypothetical protein
MITFRASGASPGGPIGGGANSRPWIHAAFRTFRAGLNVRMSAGCLGPRPTPLWTFSELVGQAHPWAEADKLRMPQSKDHLVV